MAIGFAAVTTTLVLNGTLTIGTNTSDFGIYFSKSILDSQDVSKKTISTNGQVINFEAELREIGETVELEYEVTNASKNYDAKVSVDCQFKTTNAGSTINFDEYLSIRYFNNEGIIRTRETGTGEITVTLKKSVIEEMQVGLECRLDFEAEERESLGENPSDNDPNNYTFSGYLLNQEDEKLPNTHIVILGNDNDNIYITTSDEAFLTIEGLDMGFHEIYIIENKTLEEIKDMTDQEIKDNALTHSTFTQSSKEITFDNGYKIVDELKEYIITFDANEGNVDLTTKKVIYKDTYGDLPTPTREGYDFVGWFTEKIGGTEVKNSTKVDISSNQTIYAHWTVKSYEVTIINLGYGTVAPTKVSIDYGGSNTFTIIPDDDSGYYYAIEQLTCTNGYTTNAKTGEGLYGNHMITIYNNNNDNPSVCTVEFGGE